MRRITFGRPKLRDVVKGNVASLRAMGGGAELPPELAASLAKLPLPRERVRRDAVDIDAAHRKKAVTPSEHQEQVAVIDWWRHACKGYNLPVRALLAIPNGGARDPITGSRLKAEGVRPGAPDLLLAVVRAMPPGAGLFIEMKRQKGVTSDDQLEFQKYLIAAGYAAWICYGASEAIAAIKQYLA